MKKVFLGLGKILVVIVSIGLTCSMLVAMMFDNSLSMEHTPQVNDSEILDDYQQYADQMLDAAESAAAGVDKVYWLQDEDIVAPVPDPAKYGTSTDPSELGWLFEEAAELLDGQETVFTTETKLAPGTEAIYYLDETIFAVTWKEGINNGMYTFSEVKVAHPSQFRRYHCGGTYDSGRLQTTTEMARYVNAVVASNGDFYAFRPFGTVVYEGIVCRVDPWKALDTCFIDENGDMIFSYAGELKTKEEAQKFVDENNIRFSIAFGPVIKDGDKVSNKLFSYLVGEPDDTYARAALCQKGKLHYVVVLLNGEAPYSSTDTLYGFAQTIMKLNVDKAYTLDGGQTAVMVTRNKLINRVVKGFQRDVSDIFYFATAIPNGN